MVHSCFLWLKVLMWFEFTDCAHFIFCLFIHFVMSQQPIDKPRLRIYIFIIQKHSLSRTFEDSFQVLYMWSWTRNEWIVKPEIEILPILKPCATMVQRRALLIWCDGTATFWSETTSVLQWIILRLLNLKKILDDDELLFHNNLIGYLKAWLNSLTCSHRS